MVRTTKAPNSTSAWNWSRTATCVLLAFLAIGTLELGAHQMAGAVICFALAVAYAPLRVLRGRLRPTGMRR